MLKCVSVCDVSSEIFRHDVEKKGTIITAPFSFFFSRRHFSWLKDCRTKQRERRSLLQAFYALCSAHKHELTNASRVLQGHTATQACPSALNANRGCALPVAVQGVLRGPGATKARQRAHHVPQGHTLIARTRPSACRARQGVPRSRQDRPSANCVHQGLHRTAQGHQHAPCADQEQLPPRRGPRYAACARQGRQTTRPTQSVSGANRGTNSRTTTALRAGRAALARLQTTRERQRATCARAGCTRASLVKQDARVATLGRTPSPRERPSAQRVPQDTTATQEALWIPSCVPRTRCVLRALPTM